MEVRAVDDQAAIQFLEELLFEAAAHGLVGLDEYAAVGDVRRPDA